MHVRLPLLVHVLNQNQDTRAASPLVVSSPANTFKVLILIFIFKYEKAIWSLVKSTFLLKLCLIYLKNSYKQKETILDYFMCRK